MKMYTIIGGVDGAGKSSFTGVLKGITNTLGIIADEDKITAQFGGDTLAGGKAALRLLDACLEKNVSFTQETTLSGRRTESTAKKHGSRDITSACTTSAWIPQRRALPGSRTV